MEKEWDPVQFEIIPYKETGTYILRSSEDTGQLLDDHIVMTQSMSFSPYKKPFEERINTWENKLTTTQVCMVLGIMYNSIHCSLEIFESPHHCFPKNENYV